MEPKFALDRFRNRCYRSCYGSSQCLESFSIVGKPQIMQQMAFLLLAQVLGPEVPERLFKTLFNKGHRMLIECSLKDSRRKTAVLSVWDSQLSPLTHFRIRLSSDSSSMRKGKIPNIGEQFTTKSFFKLAAQVRAVLALSHRHLCAATGPSLVCHGLQYFVSTRIDNLQSSVVFSLKNFVILES